MPLDQDTINQQFALLTTHRRSLAHLLEQAAAYGGVRLAPPQTANGIAEARAEIQRIKATLRGGGVQVEDEPNDEVPPQVEPVQRIAGDVVMGDKIGDDKVAGDKVSITNIAPNQGAQGVFHGPVNIQLPPPALAPALHQLRASVGDFVGREREIDQLVQALSKAATSGTGATISGVRGMGGIGKTELAYAAVQQLSVQFPDAQLLVELHGASANPLTPEAALQTVIRAFEREAKFPDDLSQLKTIYSSVLNGKRILILADDAKDAAQVRPLLPPSGCALLITSRNRFSLPGMAALDLGTLPPEEAEKLLLSISPRIGSFAGELAKLCGYLPLALRVSASLLKDNDTRDVAYYLGQLRAERLKYLTDPDNPDDPQASVEASLHLSYNTLEPSARTALCQLSVFPTSFDPEAAQAVVAVEGDVTKVLELLRRRSLLEWDTALERYSLHDLVRAFAAARLEDTNAVRLRHARHYVRVADRADKLYVQGSATLLVGLALFDQERLHIDAGSTWGLKRVDIPDGAALLLDYADATTNIGDLRYHKVRERIPQLTGALAASRRLGRRGAEAAVLCNLGLAYAAVGDARQAIAFYQQALAIAREIGDRGVEGTTLGNLGSAYDYLGDIHQAITLYQEALTIDREIGDRRGEGTTLGNLGLAYFNLGDTHQAITFYQQRLVIAREIGDRRGEAQALGNLGGAYFNLGDARQAIAFFDQALTIEREIGDRGGEEAVLNNLGLAYAALGDTHRAITLYQEALTIAREIGDRRGEGITLGNLGRAYAALGDARQAITLYQEALYLSIEKGAI